MGKLVDMIDFSCVPQEEIILTERCKMARRKWWRSRFNYDSITDSYVKSMEYQGKSLEEIECYKKLRDKNFLKNCPYPLDDICYRFYTDYVPF